MSDERREGHAAENQQRVRASYDAVADAYAARVHDELRHKPLDRALLGAFAEQIPGARVADVGCGPGHVGAFLAERGLTVTGIDLSPTMIDVARALHPELSFEVASMTSLGGPDARFDGIVAFYSVIHLSHDTEVAAALAEFHRVLMQDGLLLVAVHLGEHGDELVHADDMLGVSVDMEFRFFDVDRLTDAIGSAGFSVDARLIRAPYPDVEVQTRRAYLLARKVEAAVTEA